MEPDDSRLCDWCDRPWPHDYDEYVNLLEHFEPEGPHTAEEEGVTEYQFCNRQCLLHFLVDGIATGHEKTPGA